MQESWVHKHHPTVTYQASLLSGTSSIVTEIWSTKCLLKAIYKHWGHNLFCRSQRKTSLSFSPACKRAPELPERPEPTSGSEIRPSPVWATHHMLLHVLIHCRKCGKVKEKQKNAKMSAKGCEQVNIPRSETCIILIIKPLKIVVAAKYMVRINIKSYMTFASTMTIEI